MRNYGAGLDFSATAHVVQFYEHDDFLVDAVARFIGGALGAGEAAVVIATEPHRIELDAALRASGLDLALARGEGRFVALDADETLSKFMVDGWPDAARFADVVGTVVTRLTDSRFPRVRAFGEMVALLCADGKREAAIRLEELWNDLGRQRPFSLLCAYPIDAFGTERDGTPFLRICEAHSSVVPAESFTALTSTDERLRFISELQQKARVLETEIAHRREAEEALRDRNETLHALIEARQRTLNELQTLYRMGRVLSGELDLERLLQAFTDAATALSGARSGAFFHNATDEQDAHFLLYTLAGVQRESFERLATPRNTELFRSIFAGEAVIRLDDVRNAAGNAPHHRLPLGDLPIASYLAVPVVGRTGEVLGAIFLGHPDPGVFTEDAERIVVGLAAQAAVAIDNARLYDAERRARGEAEATNRAKDEFLAMLGHELRNPLSAVRNAVVTARLDPSRRERALDIARRGTEQLGRLVDDLLDVARITQGRIVLRKRRVPFASIIERAVESTRSLIEDRAHAISIALPANDLQVDADATRLEQVVVNLIANAAKYTDPGGRISVSAEQESGEAVLRVRDSGIGIAPDMLPRVFELFAQAGRALDRSEGGLGIGLTLVKRLVELHGGRVQARSDGLGKGAEFVVSLPAHLAPRDQATSGTSAGGAQRSCARVLLVEDNEDAADSLMMLLEVLGHRVRVSRDGPSALETARANPPDVMLVDIGLPGMDGYEVARQIRQDPALRRVVLVALTGYGRDEDRQRALAAGFDYHLVKPVNPDALEGLVAQFPSADATTVH